jgi:3-hydroxyisobutyrate dehydrogenase
LAKVAFLGLGVMGYPMAGHLARHGHDVVVFNRTGAKAQSWAQEHGGRTAATPAEAAADREIVFACVGNDDDLTAITIGDGGAFGAMAAGSIFVDHTTASADIARRLHSLAAERGIGFLDAPVSGGQHGAEEGVLSVMVGGEAEIFARAEPVITAYSRICRLMGPAGSGQLAKMVNQICVVGIVQGLAEGVHFAQRAGLDLDAVFDVISKGAARSGQMDTRFAWMAEGRFEDGFAVDWMRKDLGICLTEARRNGAQLPATALIEQFYAELQALGRGRWDSSSLFTRLKPKGE